MTSDVLTTSPLRRMKSRRLSFSFLCFLFDMLDLSPLLKMSRVALPYTIVVLGVIFDSFTRQRGYLH